MGYLNESEQVLNDFTPYGFERLKNRDFIKCTHEILAPQDREILEKHIQRGDILNLNSPDGKGQLRVFVGNVSFKPEQWNQKCSMYAVEYYLSRI